TTVWWISGSCLVLSGFRPALLSDRVFEKGRTILEGFAAFRKRQGVGTKLLVDYGFELTKFIFGKLTIFQKSFGCRDWGQTECFVELFRCDRSFHSSRFDEVRVGVIHTVVTPVR